MYSSWVIIENVNNEITNVIKIVMFLPAASFVGFLLDQRKLVGPQGAQNHNSILEAKL